jgi:indole-3-glycerol phosphate synthase
LHILDRIVAHKQLEIKALYEQYDVEILRHQMAATPRSFYARIADARLKKAPFFIFEFKRKSPSEGWIAQHAIIEDQINYYVQSGAGAISVLTDTEFFGGGFDDLRAARAAAGDDVDSIILLQKDFVIDPIQIYLARQAGADMILLIAAILDADQLDALRKVAESLGMGVLVEVHDQEELDKVQHLDFPVLGVNNRDLKTFRVALNRANVLAQQARGRAVIAESGLHDACDFAAVQGADGFLIGTSLMRGGKAHAFRSGWVGLKACGIRTTELLSNDTADLIGINFSPVSKRRVDPALLDAYMAEYGELPPNAVALFYENSEDQVISTLQKYPFRRVQLYAGDVSVDFVRRLRTKVILAVRVRTPDDLAVVEEYAPDVDFFILDGAVPGSGQSSDIGLIPADFPYPFMLAGGISTSNIPHYERFEHCIGLDVASGIETDGMVDRDKIASIRAQILTRMR